MYLTWWRRWLRRLGRQRPRTGRPRKAWPRPVDLELLERRDLPSGATHPVVMMRPNINPLGSGSGSPNGLTPEQIRIAYGLDDTSGNNQILFSNIVGDGTGQTIAIVDAYDQPGFLNSTDPNWSTSDLAQFDAQFGLPDPPSFTKVNQNGSTSNLPGTDPSGPTSQSGSGSWELEEALDVEWAHVIAPGASIILVECNDASGDSIPGWPRRQRCRGSPWSP